MLLSVACIMYAADEEQPFETEWSMFGNSKIYIPPGSAGKRTSYTDDISKRHWKEWLVYAVVGIKNGIPSAAFLTLED